MSKIEHEASSGCVFLDIDACHGEAADRVRALEALAVELAAAAGLAKGELYWLDQQERGHGGEYVGFRKGGSVDQARTALASALASPLLAEILGKEGA